MAAIRVGIGGWTFEPWRGTFYPPGLPQAQELSHASRQLRTLEINGTFYRTQSPATFAKWAREVPDGFVFTVKAPRAATSRRVLAEAGESIAWFFGSGVTELGDRLGPVLWQLPPFRRFDAADLDAFLAQLPRERDGLRLRHALEVRHDSFRCAEYLALARRHGVATVFTDSDDYPGFADLTGDFVYARVMRTEAARPLGVEEAALASLVACARRWREGGEPDGLPRVEPAPAPGAPRDVFLFFISAAKARAPLAAVALTARLAAAGL